MSRSPEQAPSHLSFLETTERRTKFLPPAQVTQAALTEIRLDGSVIWDNDEETGEPVFFQPEEPVDLEALAPDNYAHTLYEVADAINGTVLHISDDSSVASAQFEVRLLASALSAYRHDPAFVEYAASLTWFDEHGFMHNPRLPQENPWEWVPRLRTELAYQNASRKAAEQT